LLPTFDLSDMSEALYSGFMRSMWRRSPAFTGLLLVASTVFLEAALESALHGGFEPTGLLLLVGCIRQMR
jgi:hypothetical protein